MLRVAVVTNMPAYHQVDFFNALHAGGEISLHVYYLRRLTPGRQWTTLQPIAHPHTFVRELPVHRFFYLNVGLLPRLVRFRPDLVVVTQYASIAMQAVMYACTTLRRPWVFWSERPGVEHTELPIFRSDLARRVSRRVALAPIERFPREIWATGERTARWYAERTGSVARSLPYSSDLTRFADARDAAPARAPGPVRFLYAGKFVDRKGTDVLVQAARQLAAEAVPFRLTLAGDGDHKPQVLALAADLPDQVEYVGFKQLPEVPGVFASADVLVCPSRYDGWGMVVPEALASGMPVVATTATHAAVDLLDDDVGRLVPPGDAAALAAAMRDLATRPDLARMAAAARSRARPYDSAVMAKRAAAMMREVVGRPPC